MTNKLKTLLKIAITLGILTLIIHRFGWQKIVVTVSQAKFGWLGVGVIIFILSVFVGALQWYVILRHKGINLPLLKATQIYYMGIFFNNFVFGTVAGDTFKIAKIHLDKKGGKLGFAATVLDRLMNLMILSFFAIIGGVIIFARNIQQNKQFFMVMGVLAIFISIFTGFFVILISKRLQNNLRSFLQKLPEFPLKEVIRSAAEETFIDRHNEKKMLLQIAFISFVIQTLRALVNIFCALALDMFSFSTLHYFMVIIPVLALLMIPPMPFGVRETIGGILFGLAGFSTQDSVIMLFLTSFVCVSGSLIGGIFFIFEKRSKANVQIVPEPE